MENTVIDIIIMETMDIDFLIKVFTELMLFPHLSLFLQLWWLIKIKNPKKKMLALITKKKTKKKYQE